MSNEYTVLDGRCIDCGKQVFVSVKTVDFEKRKKDGSAIKKAYPYLSESQTVFVMTRCCLECYHKAFKGIIPKDNLKA